MALPVRLNLQLPRLRHCWRPLLTLVFLLGGSALVLGLLAMLAYRQGAFEPQLRISVRVPDAQGLRPGSRVTLSGVPVGVLRWLEIQPDGQVLLHLTLPVRYRGVVSPGSSLSISQDFLVGDPQIRLQPAPVPAASVPDRFTVPYRDGASFEDLLAQVGRTLERVDALLLSGERLGKAELPRTLQQLRTSLQRADALSGTLQRELPPTAEVLRHTGREAGSTAREAREAARELLRTLLQVRPQLSTALQQLDITSEEAQELLVWLNQLIDRLDPSFRLRRSGPRPPADPPSFGPAVSPAAPSGSAGEATGP